MHTDLNSHHTPLHTDLQQEPYYKYQPLAITDLQASTDLRAPIYLSVGLSMWVCLYVDLSVWMSMCVGVFVFVCIWEKEDEELRLLCTEKREKNWCEQKLIKN